MNELDCEQVLQEVWRYLDGEMDEARYREIQAHVADCAGCGPRFEFQHRLLALIQEKCQEGPIPASLKERLFKLLEEQG